MFRSRIYFLLIVVAIAEYTNSLVVGFVESQHYDEVGRHPKSDAGCSGKLRKSAFRSSPCGNKISYSGVTMRLGWSEKGVFSEHTFSNRQEIMNRLQYPYL